MAKKKEGDKTISTGQTPGMKNSRAETVVSPATRQRVSDHQPEPRVGVESTGFIHRCIISNRCPRISVEITVDSVKGSGCCYQTSSDSINSMVLREPLLGRNGAFRFGRIPGGYVVILYLVDKRPSPSGTWSTRNGTDLGLRFTSSTIFQTCHNESNPQIPRIPPMEQTTTDRIL